MAVLFWSRAADAGKPTPQCGSRLHGEASLCRARHLVSAVRICQSSAPYSLRRRGEKCNILGQGAARVLRGFSLSSDVSSSGPAGQFPC